MENRKIRPTDVSMGQVKRIVKCIEVLDNDKFFYCGTSTGDIIAINMDTRLFQVGISLGERILLILVHSHLLYSLKYFILARRHLTTNIDIKGRVVIIFLASWTNKRSLQHGDYITGHTENWRSDLWSRRWYSEHMRHSRTKIQEN